MKSIKTNVTPMAFLLLALTTVLALTTTVTFAQSHGDRHRHENRHFGVISHLDLNPEQLEILNNLRASQQESKKAQHQLRQSLQQLVQSDNYSYAEADSIARQISELQHSQIVANAEAHHTLYQTLSDEQKQKAATLHEKKAFRHGSR